MATKEIIASPRRDAPTEYCTRFRCSSDSLTSGATPASVNIASAWRNASTVPTSSALGTVRALPCTELGRSRREGKHLGVPRYLLQFPIRGQAAHVPRTTARTFPSRGRSRASLGMQDLVESALQHALRDDESQPGIICGDEPCRPRSLRRLDASKFFSASPSQISTCAIRVLESVPVSTMTGACQARQHCARRQAP